MRVYHSRTIKIPITKIEVLILFIMRFVSLHLLPNPFRTEDWHESQARPFLFLGNIVMSMLWGVLKGTIANDKGISGPPRICVHDTYTLDI